MSTKTYRTGFERIYDCPAGRRILAQTRSQPRRLTPASDGAIDWTAPALPDPSDLNRPGFGGGSDSTEDGVMPAPKKYPPEPPAERSVEGASTERVVRTTVAIGFLLAAAYLGLLGTKRLRQQRRRRPGHQAKVPEVMSDLELAMRTIEEPASIDLLDRALRSMVCSAAANGCTLPRLTAAVVAPGSVRIMLADNAVRPIAPFTVADGGWWVLDRKSEY